MDIKGVGGWTSDKIAGGFKHIGLLNDTHPHRQILPESESTSVAHLVTRTYATGACPLVQLSANSGAAGRPIRRPRRSRSAALYPTIRTYASGACPVARSSVDSGLQPPPRSSRSSSSSCSSAQVAFTALSSVRQLLAARPRWPLLRALCVGVFALGCESATGSLEAAPPRRPLASSRRDLWQQPCGPLIANPPASFVSARGTSLAGRPPQPATDHLQRDLRPPLPPTRYTASPNAGSLTPCRRNTVPHSRRDCTIVRAIGQHSRTYYPARFLLRRLRNSTSRSLETPPASGRSIALLLRFAVLPGAARREPAFAARATAPGASSSRPTSA
ncbi:hypothetical protein PR003_g10018 [Phytophthora rubi]|uniref:Uncharacterized protein n=1 Tax=Phytophthora rubi TaxID=129364 RepID=A0A6A4FGJ6_9STRA|nr:hypothetical protein PR003_g10018 [Phytophthora rubi]